ncbi:MAG: Gx transporter family protein [Clostridia bacterium]|nr:Gx transporter family protein [Clostridia bacterium]
MSKRFNTKRVALCGLLLAMMLILGWIEKQIPTPHPAMKLGLSNSVLIFAVYMLDIPTAYVLMFFKVFLSNVMFGSLGVSFAMGLAGGFVSLTAMVLLSRVKGMHTVTVSIVGGVMHHVGQILMALLVVNTPGLLTALPFLMIAGLIFGAVTGVCADRVMKYMKHMRL